MITGGADSKIHPLSLVRMSLLDQMSRWSGRPGRGLPAVRPPPRRLGPRRGGGHPDPRGARARPAPRGQDPRRDPRLRARAATPCPAGASTPRGAGTEIAISAALRDAGLAPSEIGHVNAHGVGLDGRRPGRGPGLPPRLRRRGPRPGHGPQGLHGQPRLRLRRGRADRQPARRQPRPDPARR